MKLFKKRINVIFSKYAENANRSFGYTIKSDPHQRHQFSASFYPIGFGRFVSILISEYKNK